jgi:hypothetical protein
MEVPQSSSTISNRSQIALATAAIARTASPMALTFFSFGLPRFGICVLAK